MVKLDYLDFELKIVGKDGRYEVHVLRSPTGEARCEFQRSLSDDQLENLLLKLARVRSVTRRIDPPQLAAARQIGTELFRATFRDTVRDCLRSSIAAAQRDGCGLRLKLRLQDAPELAVLPWEFLYDPDAARFLARSAYTPIVRYVELPESIPTIKTAQPLRLLGIIASPQDYDGLDIARERKLLEDALTPLVESGHLEISWLEKPTLASLRRALRKDSYHILHFIGHGGFHEQTQQGVLVFEDERANAALVDAEMLGVLLHDHHSLRLVVLNACEGARNAADDPFAGVATTLVRQGIPAVVAMQFVITDKAAIAFAEEFYAAIADGFPVDTAMAEARKAVLSTPNEVEWGTPVLLLRTPSGELFDIQAKAPEQHSTEAGTAARQENRAEAPASSTAMEDKPAGPEKIGLDGGSASTSVPEISAPQSDQANENRQRQLADLWTSALTAFFARRWAAAIPNFQAILELDAHYKDAAAKLSKAQQEIAKAEQEQRLASMYASAIQAHDVGDLSTVVDTLQQLVAEHGSYKDAAALLEGVRKTMLLSARYDDARTLASAEQWRAVLEVFEEILELNPDFPDPEQLRETARAKLAEQARLGELENLLSQALNSFEASEWQDARVRLTRIQGIEPDYKGSAQLLLRADQELAALLPTARTAQGQDAGDERRLKDAVNSAITSIILIKLGNYVGPVRSIAFSPDGKVIASSGGSDKTVRLWDAATGKALRTLEGHSSSVRSVAFSLDGRVIASSGGNDNAMLRWDEARNDRTVRLWDAATGDALCTIEVHSIWINCIAFSPDGKVIASSGNRDKTVWLWDAATGKALRTLKGHTSWVDSIAFSLDGKVIASGSDDNTVRLWDAATGTALRTFEGHSSGINCIAFNPDGKVIASGSNDKTVRLWDAATGTTLRTLSGQSDRVRSITFSPDGKVIASGSDDKVRLWDAATGKTLRTLKGHTSWVDSIAFSPDGKVIASSSNDRTVRLWDAATGTAMRTLQGPDNPVHSIAFSPDGKVIASGSGDNTVRLWDAATGTALRTLAGHFGPVYSVTFSPDGKVIASSGSNDNTVRLWDAATGTALRTLKGQSYRVRSITFSPDGKVIAGGSDDKVRLWDAATGKTLRTLKGHTSRVDSIAFSPDGKVIASSGSRDKTVRLWDAATGTAMRTIEGHSNSFRSVAFSPDGKVIASISGFNKSVQLWDAATGAALCTLLGHSSGINCIAFSPDGKVIAGGGNENIVGLWDLATGVALRTLEGHSSWINSVTFSPDGRFIASGSDDNTVRLWEINTA